MRAVAMAAGLAGCGPLAEIVDRGDRVDPYEYQLSPPEGCYAGRAVDVGPEDPLPVGTLSELAAGVEGEYDLDARWLDGDVATDVAVTVDVGEQGTWTPLLFDGEPNDGCGQLGTLEAAGTLTVTSSDGKVRVEARPATLTVFGYGYGVVDRAIGADVELADLRDVALQDCDGDLELMVGVLFDDPNAWGPVSGDLAELCHARGTLVHPLLRWPFDAWSR
jgi:hypothetical protein